jgi:hypothetical protein
VHMSALFFKGSDSKQNKQYNVVDSVCTCISIVRSGHASTYSSLIMLVGVYTEGA